MRRVVLALASLALLLGGLAASVPAGAATAHPVHHAGVAIPAAGISDNSVCDQPSGQNQRLCLNDSGYACTTSTPVIAYAATQTSNEDVYTILQGDGHYTFHFKSCGNSWCIWQYGFGTGGNYLYMHQCDGSGPNDQFNINVDGAYNTFTNPFAPGGWNFMGLSSVQGRQAFTSSYVAGYSDFLEYNP